MKIRYNRNVLKAWFLSALLSVCFAIGGNSQTINYRSQSLYIYKFTKHIHWPQEKQKGDFIIGVYGNSPIFNELMTMATIKKAGNGQNIVIKKIVTIEQVQGVHMLYITSSKSREVSELANVLNEKAILMVAERGGLARKGACINFIIMENDVLKFEININELKKHKLQIDKALLDLGFIVG